MKDKIVYLVIGILITTIITLLVNNTNNLNADNYNDATFDRIIIKGSLTVGEGENKITLKNKRDESQIIIQSKDTAIIISAKPNDSNIILTPDHTEREKINVSMLTSKILNGKPTSFITLMDGNGVKQIGTD